MRQLEQYTESCDQVSAVFEAGVDIISADEAESRAGRIDDFRETSGPLRPNKLFEFREDHLNRIQVRAIRGK